MKEAFFSVGKVTQARMSADTHTHTPGLQLQGPLLSRDLEAVRVVFVGGLLHLHAVHSYSTAHGETLADQAELGGAAQQEVVELDETRPGC